jgi:Protein of unknown function (DUF4232)
MRGLLLGSLLAVSIVGCAGPSNPPPSSSPPSAPPSGSQSSVLPSAPPSAPATPRPSHTPIPTPKPIAVCLATQLAAKVTSWQGAAGHQLASVTLTNTSAHTCTVQGTPEVELLDVHGGILIDSQTGGPNGLPHVAAGSPAFHLAHGGWLKTTVQDGNYCGAAAALPTSVAFVLPVGAGRLVAAPGPGGTTPPCLGAPGSLGSITMNAWRK